MTTSLRRLLNQNNQHLSLSWILKLIPAKGARERDQVAAVRGGVRRGDRRDRNGEPGFVRGERGDPVAGPRVRRRAAVGPVMGAERLRDRVRGAAGPGRPGRGPD